MTLYEYICTIIRLTLRKLASISITKLSQVASSAGAMGLAQSYPPGPEEVRIFMGCLLGNTRDTLGFMVI